MPIELDDTVAPAPSTTPVDKTTTQVKRAQAIARAGHLEAGRRLAHFRIERLLGEGGMGQVYLATDLALDRPVALKVLPGGAGDDVVRRERLVREARAQARIHHPNVCHIYFIGEEDGHLFFAMEYVDGESVAELLTRGPVTPDRALAIVRMAAEGLREADRQGFTHRDVKPSNLMIDRAGRVKVVDFGLVTDSPRDSRPNASSDITATGIAGTPLYMAPEQARGEAVDRRADVYALGATLYHLLAGAPPFSAPTPGELYELHSTAIRPTLPRGRENRRRLPVLNELVARMMATAPDDRIASYDDLIDQLDRASPVVTRPAGAVARIAAALIDLLILVPFSIGLELLPYELVFDADAIIIPGLWLYGSLLTWRFGKTAGKALLDIEVVPASGTRRRIPFRAAALRTAIYVLPIEVATILDEIGKALSSKVLEIIATVIVALAFCVPMLFLAVSSWRRADKRAPWDVAAGTMVRYHRPTLE